MTDNLKCCNHPKMTDFKIHFQEKNIRQCKQPISRVDPPFLFLPLKDDFSEQLLRGDRTTITSVSSFSNTIMLSHQFTTSCNSVTTVSRVRWGGSGECFSSKVAYVSGYVIRILAYNALKGAFSDSSCYQNQVSGMPVQFLAYLCVLTLSIKESAAVGSGIQTPTSQRRKREFIHSSNY